MVVATVLQLSQIAVNAWILALVLLVCGTMDADQARDAASGKTLLTIAASFGVGAGVENSSLALALSNSLIKVTHPMGPYGVLAGFYLMSAITASLIGSNSTVVLLRSVAIAVAREIGVSEKSAIFALMYAAAAA